MSKSFRTARSSVLTPKVIGTVVTLGFAAAGIAKLVAQNLRTIGDTETALGERVKKVGQDSVGAVLRGASGLAERGREAVSAERRGSTDPTPVPRDTGSETPGTQKATPKKATPIKATAKKATAKKATAKKQIGAGASDAASRGAEADLERMTVAQLRDRAKSAGLPGRSSMNKSELVSALAAREDGS